jgi:hypothetical protein
MTAPRYPDITVKLTGHEGNALYVLGTVARALRDSGVPRGEVMAFQQEACHGDSAHLLRTVREWVTVE